MENQFSLPRDTRNTHLLPDRVTAKILVDSFFVNVRTMWEWKPRHY
jgi:hypothetical protein